MIKGFENDVGTKISFYGFTVNTMKNSLISYSNVGFTSVPQGQVRPQWAPWSLTAGAVVSCLHPPSHRGAGHGAPKPQPSGWAGCVPGSRACVMGCPVAQDQESSGVELE